MTLIKPIFKSTLATALLCGTLSASATVGGDITLEVLGYEPIDQKVYVLHNHEDGWGGSKLYYFDLKGKNPNKAHEAKSYYNKDSMGIEYDDEDKTAVKKLDNLKKHLTPLTPISTDGISVKILSTKTRQVESWGADGTDTAYHHQYRVTSGKYRSTTQKVVAFEPTLSISQAYKVPKHDKIVVGVKYLETRMESGYTKEDPVILNKSK